MTTWVPEELPQGWEPAPANPDAVMPPAPHAAAPNSQFGGPLPGAPAPAFTPGRPLVGVEPPARSKRAWRVVAVAAIVVAVVAIGFAVSQRSSPGSNPVYSGAPVEASDALDGVTIVGLDDTIAYVPEPQWREVTESFEFEGATGPAAVADDVVGAHTFDAPDGRGVFVIVLGHRGEPADDPKDRFAAVLTEVYSLHVAELTGPVQRVETAQGLEGAVGLFDRPLLEERLYTRFAVLGHGSNSAIVEWISVGTPPDEAAFRRLLDTVRIDG